MENNNGYFQNYSGFEFSTRKGRGKKKRKNNNRRSAVNSTEDTKSESETSNTLESLESVGDFNHTDENLSGVEDADDDFDKGLAVVFGNVDTTSNLDSGGGTVSFDGMMSAPPTYDEDDKVKLMENNELKTPDEPVEKSPDPISSIINTRALRKEATTYELEKFEKNALVIINQVHIEGHHPRLGTEKDVDSLTRTFQNFGFEVSVLHELTKDEIFKELNNFGNKDFTDYGCVAVAVLTHGSNNGLLKAKDQPYSEIEIINLFKDYSKPTLVTKPKLIIIQACRGTQIKQGVSVFSEGRIHKDHTEDFEPYILPVESDLLVLHSSYVGSPSHRNDLHGSWFIQELCKKINTLAQTHDIESIITEVKKEVAINREHEEYNRRTLEMNVSKQMPVMTSTLIRKLYLRKFGEVVNEESYADMLKQPTESKQVLASTPVASAPVTPLLVQFGPCSCFLEHFTYMRNCLRYFVEENPNDEIAKTLLDLAIPIEDSVEFNTLKDTMCRAISKHLFKNARSSRHYKFLYFYK